MGQSRSKKKGGDRKDNAKDALPDPDHFAARSSNAEADVQDEEAFERAPQSSDHVNGPSKQESYGVDMDDDGMDLFMISDGEDSDHDAMPDADAIRAP